jgi:predicted AlkP superfamily pyrophosphatase or phosphodiesterase
MEKTQRTNDLSKNCRPAAIRDKESPVKMNRLAASTWAAALAAIVLANAGLAQAAAEATAAGADRIVVMISVDGLAGFYFDDPKADMPTIRKLAAEGAATATMKASTPTVTWPNHTTLVTGVTPARHGVIGNNYLDRGTRKTVTLIWDPLLDKDQIVKTPTIYDLAKAQGLTTAAIRWPATRNAKAIDFNSPDLGRNTLVRRYTTPALMEECKQAGYILDDNGGQDDPKGRPYEAKDDMWTHVFVNILRDHRPQLALLHVISVDHTEHIDGPRSREAYAAIKTADDQVREVWEELQKDYAGKATLVVVSDHGFSPIERAILPNVALRKAGLVQVKDDKVVGGPVAWLSQGGSAFIYVLDESRHDELIAQVRETIGALEGVTKIIGVDQYAEYGIPDPKVDPHAPDLIAFAGMGYNFGDTSAGEIPLDVKPERKGSHGHDASLPDLHALFVACGAGINRGVQLGEIDNRSVAPTLAKLLNIEMPNVDGHVLDAALAK